MSCDTGPFVLATVPSTSSIQYQLLDTTCLTFQRPYQQSDAPITYYLQDGSVYQNSYPITVNVAPNGFSSVGIQFMDPNSGKIRSYPFNIYGSNNPLKAILTLPTIISSDSCTATINNPNQLSIFNINATDARTPHVVNDSTGKPAYFLIPLNLGLYTFGWQVQVLTSPVPTVITLNVCEPSAPSAPVSKAIVMTTH